MPRYLARFTLVIEAENEDEALIRAWDVIEEGEAPLLLDEVEFDDPFNEGYPNDVSRKGSRA